jgi:MFS family permease
MGDAWIGLITTVAAFVPILSYPIWGRIADRLGNSRLMVIGCLGVSLFPLTTAISSRPEYLLLPAVIGGIFSPAWALGVFNGLYEVIPADEQATFISVNTAVLNLAAFAAPLISTVILVPLIGIGPSLLMCSAARALGALAMYIVTRSL